jgi:hypothetical protein
MFAHRKTTTIASLRIQHLLEIELVVCEMHQGFRVLYVKPMHDDLGCVIWIVEEHLMPSCCGN